MCPVLAGRYSADATTFTCTILSEPEPYTIPPVLYSCFQHARQPLLRGIQTRETSVYRGDSFTRQRLCGTDPVSARYVYMYTIMY